MYKGYKVYEVILRDAQVPETAILINASVGCSQCEKEGRVQLGHEKCDRYELYVSVQ